MEKLLAICIPLLVVFAGCNGSQRAEQAAATSTTVADSKTQGLIPQNSPPDPRFERAASAPLNEEKARQLVLELQSQLVADLAAMEEKIGVAADDREKMRLYEELNPVPGFVQDVLQTVQSFPETAAGFEAAIAGLGYAEGPQRGQLMDYLLDRWADRLNHRKIVSYLLKQVPSPQVEVWFEKVIAAAPAGVVQAEALLGFKTYFDQKPVFAKTLAYNPQIADQIPAMQRDYIDAERSVAQNARIAKYLQAVIDHYSELKYTGSGFGSADTFGLVAQQELFELNHLNVGDLAPDIEGCDLDGHAFRLSDYRGKVVMLDFWGQWCPPCRRMYPYERELVRRLSGLPFALIGVNSDGDLETARNSVHGEKLPWRNFWNGPDGTGGPIARQWNISEWPTVYLIDADGVIRFKGVLGNEIERGLEVLLAEVGHEVDLNPVEVVAR